MAATSLWCFKFEWNINNNTRYWRQQQQTTSDNKQTDNGARCRAQQLITAQLITHKVSVPPTKHDQASFNQPLSVLNIMFLFHFCFEFSLFYGSVPGCNARVLHILNAFLLQIGNWELVEGERTWGWCNKE